SLMVVQEETDGAIIGVCNACGAFLSRTAKTCPVCGSPSEENITVAISSGGPGEKIETEKAQEIYGFDPRLETQGKIFLCEVCGAFVSQGAETCPICNSPTANMKREVISIGEGLEMSSDEVINLLEKEIIHAMESADGGKREREVEVRQEPVLEENVEPETVELPSFEDVEKELRESLPEHQPDTGKEEEMEQVNHLVDVHSAVTSEIGDILVESVVRERFTVEETDTPEKVEHRHDPVADVESELWEYLLESEEEMPVKENECPICGYKNSPDAEKCEICGSTIKEEKVEEIPGAEEKEKVKKEVVEEQALPETKFKEVKKEEPLPLVSARVKALPLEKKGTLETMLEKNSHILLAVSLALVGISGVLALGLTIQAAAVIALGFLIVGVFFSFLILRSQKKPQKSVRVSQPSRPSEIALFNMGSTYLATGRFAEAVKAFEEVVKINPGNEVAWNNLGSALSKLERHEEALKCYEKALEINPDFEIVWNNKGNALARLGRFEEALKCYDKAIALRRDYHDAWVNKGYVLVKTGRYNEAIACANEANKILERAYG
ncbi:MAG: tetratricopeptide repeat protein, partial [Thermoplasmata archaeon]